MEKIRVLYVKPMEEPQVIEIANTLEVKQELVGGPIEAVYPSEEDMIALVCNEEGKYDESALPNRVLYDEESGMPYDVVHGAFLITGLTEDNFGSLDDKMLQKYKEKFRYPEAVIMQNGRIIIYSANPKIPVRVFAARKEGA